MMSLFLSTKGVQYGVINVNLKMDLCPDELLEFEIAESSSTIKTLGSYQGLLRDSSNLQFNLHPYIEHELEFRIIYKAGLTTDCGGVSIDKLLVLSS